MSFLVLRAYQQLIYFDLFLARGNFSALYKKVSEYSIGQAPEMPWCNREGLRGCRHGMHLVLEGSALPTAIRGNNLSFAAARSASPDDDRRTADAIQGACMG